MKLLLNLATGLLCALPVLGQQTIQEYDWKDLATTNSSSSAVPVKVDGRATLKIENTNATSLRASLMILTNPPVTDVCYALQGEVRYADVQGGGYLEMWSYFPPEKSGAAGGAYFSRTLGDGGEMGRLSGTSDWRKFILPFNRKAGTPPPTCLEFNLILPGRGTVYLGPVKLVQFSSAYFPSNGGWWSDRTGNTIGGWAGAFVGCLCGLCGWLSSRGKARAFVSTMYLILAVMGAILGAAGVTALVLHQPYGVWYPLVLGGVLLAVLCPFVLWQNRKRYEQVELRRMDSLDASAM